MNAVGKRAKNEDFFPTQLFFALLSSFQNFSIQLFINKIIFCPMRRCGSIIKYAKNVQ